MSRLSAPYVLKPSRKIDFMVGSERMLKAHHKNGVFFKSLENKKNNYDASCNKNLSKMQQEIYDVYFNEYLPLKEQASKTKFFPKLRKKQPPKYKKLATIKGNDQILTLPDIGPNDNLTGIKNKHKSSECFIESLRAKEVIRQRERKPTLASLMETGYKMNGGLYTCSQSSLWADNLSDCSHSPDIDEYRLKILKAAIALTSQPAKTPECVKKPRRLRRSFLLTLRRTSKMVWENDLLKRAGPPPRMKAIDNYKDSMKDSMIAESDESDGKSSTAIDSAVLKWRPSIFKNRILNDDDEDEEDIVFEFSDRQSRESFVSMISGVVGKTPRMSIISDAPLHDIEADLYNPESSPDIFSVISERTGSSFSDYSYTSESGSYYSTASDDDFQ